MSTFLTEFNNNDIENVTYQLDFVTPVISPFDANLRKHKRHIPNFL